ncbi:hypothetical protein Tco_0441704, partial [Tanacetum coccineum]
QTEQWMDNEISFPSVPGCQLVDSPIILEPLIKGFQGRRIEEDGGSAPERRITHPRIQASRLEETTIKEKEEIQEQNNEKEETDKSRQSSSSHPDRESIREKKDKENDKLPKALNESTPQKR